LEYLGECIGILVVSGLKAGAISEARARATARTTADPYGMTSKKGKCDGKGKNKYGGPSLSTSLRVRMTV
jgi:hypothetical protein